VVRAAALGGATAGALLRARARVVGLALLPAAPAQFFLWALVMQAHYSAPALGLEVKLGRVAQPLWQSPGMRFRRAGRRACASAAAAASSASSVAFALRRRDQRASSCTSALPVISARRAARSSALRRPVLRAAVAKHGDSRQTGLDWSRLDHATNLEGRLKHILMHHQETPGSLKGSAVKACIPAPTRCIEPT
jgi:hypothetical protein